MVIHARTHTHTPFVLLFCCSFWSAAGVALLLLPTLVLLLQLFSPLSVIFSAFEVALSKQVVLHQNIHLEYIAQSRQTYAAPARQESK